MKKLITPPYPIASNQLLMLGSTTDDLIQTHDLEVPKYLDHVVIVVEQKQTNSPFVLIGTLVVILKLSLIHI